MANVLVLAEVSGDKVKSVTFEILGKLAGHTVDVAAFGEVPAAAVAELAKYGAANVHSIKGLDNYSPEGYTNSLKDFISSKSYDYVFAGATSLGKDLLPRVAGAFDAGMASEVTNFTMDGGAFAGTRPMFSGKCLAKVEITGPKPHFVSVRPNALGMPENATAGAGAASEVSANAGEIRAMIKEIIKGASEKLDLTEANIIVSGGRAMKSADNFKILNELADVVGATVGASRAAVDSGFAAPSMQVGQTGKTVAPTLYIACGISGAIQHLAGMRTSKVIVAINTDPDAPIFTKADYGIVGDLFQIVPLLTEEFKKVLA
ncbi:putative electron transfer flavoprotein, alpha subunit [Bacteriovorax sp. BSW11_IV]|uniref:electron transfer flavoprotein subunit alpha/FixB family protein n=1 Tax=Bacteriovorax sp. BSW11_IV TaxID=1353529 RepID=UPI00038A515E|nr:electron transfer flavoprotein subunit alpha/FixB family protein [Bacteriovorax sp. BSW11_IV]EQC49999.1 putative electron transfer flavoprotein, alpha subunit [Bacteriovorax sp. BSW11_IV]